MVLLSGPSCVGKGPLRRAMKKLYPDTDKVLRPVVLYNDRPARVGEVNREDYNFETTDTIRNLDKAKFVIIEIRKDNWQALPLAVLQDYPDGVVVFAEVHYKFVEEIVGGSSPIDLTDLDVKKVFLSPLSKHEILYLLARPNMDGEQLKKLVAEIMRRKLVRRTRRQKTDLSLEDLKDIEKRATRAYEEMTYAWLYDFVIPNQDGEDSDNWDQFYFPIGGALKTCEAFKAILDGASSVPGAEKWDETLLP
jgi:guanylate kinase